jgi:hypothetical protein
MLEILSYSGARGRQAVKLMIIGALLVAVVSGCAAKINARADREASKTVYEECLAQHLQDVSACEGARQAYEADLAIYRAISAGARPTLPSSSRQVLGARPTQCPSSLDRTGSCTHASCWDPHR